MHDVWFGCPLMTLVLLVTRVTWVTRMGWAPLWVDFHRSLWRMKVSWDIEQATERERERGSDLLYCFWFRFAHFYNLEFINCPQHAADIYISLFKQISRSIFFKFFVKSENNQSFEDVDPLEKNPKTVLQLPGFFTSVFFCVRQSHWNAGPAKGGGTSIYIIFKYPRNLGVWSMM